MIQFKTYNSIENTFDAGFIDVILLEGLDKQEFVVQEKVHGSNVCFITDGETVSFGKRTGLVEVDEAFFLYEVLLERYTPQVIRLFSMIKEKYSDVEAVTIFGEMFGGVYPHPDVANDRKIMAIQKGVFYCPQHEFYAFDLYIRTAKTGRFLDVNEANSFYEQGGFFYAKTLFSGSLAQCLQYPNDFTSLISKWLGFPPIEDNVCEGIVIRPVKPTYLSNGARVLLKNKNARFAEKKSRKKRDPKLFVPPTYSEPLVELLEIVEQYVTENRLNNVVSKIGQISLPKEVGMLMGMFSKDILEDFLKEHSGQYAGIEKMEQKIFNRHVNTLAVNLIKQVYFR